MLPRTLAGRPGLSHFLPARTFRVTSFDWDRPGRQQSRWPSFGCPAEWPHQTLSPRGARANRTCLSSLLTFPHPGGECRAFDLRARHARAQTHQYAALVLVSCGWALVRVRAGNLFEYLLINAVALCSGDSVYRGSGIQLPTHVLEETLSRR